MHHNPIIIHDLSYAYEDGTQALNAVSFAVRPSERVALVGANGSGKSTLLRHLNGLLLPQQGTVEIGDYPVQKETLRRIRDFAGLVFQNPDDQLFMPTVFEDVAFGPMNQGIAGTALQQRVQQALQSVELDPSQYGSRLTTNLSGGEKKRVAIAGVLAMQPQVLLLDEPTAQLDPRARRSLIQLLQTLPLTQVIATHDLDLALDLCQRTLVLSQGRVVKDGSTPEVLSDDSFLVRHALELPLCFRQPYCLLQDSPRLASDRRGV